MVNVYVDEVGMSSIAGDLIVGAVAVDENEKPPISGIRDSKKLTKKTREKLSVELMKLPHSIKSGSVKNILDYNVFYARFLAMKEAVLDFINRGIKIKKVIVDGKFIIPDLDIEQEAVIKADAKFWQTGAASIIAKVHRDNMMEELSKTDIYSYYGFENNAGYYSPTHRLGIVLHGPCDIHRTQFMYFKYCMERYKEYQAIKDKIGIDDFFKDNVVNGKKKSDYIIWKESKKIWKPILPNMEIE